MRPNNGGHRDGVHLKLAPTPADFSVPETLARTTIAIAANTPVETALSLGSLSIPPLESRKKDDEAIMSNDFVTREELEAKLELADTKNQVRYEKLVGRVDVGFSNLRGEFKELKADISWIKPIAIGMVVGFAGIILTIFLHHPDPTYPPVIIQQQPLQAPLGQETNGHKERVSGNH